MDENLRHKISAAIDAALDQLPDRELDLDRKALDELTKALNQAHEWLAKL